jgi:hypothetical protein
MKYIYEMIQKLKSLLYTVLILSTSASAQSELGVTAGMNHSGFYGRRDGSYYIPTFEHHIGYTASVFYKEPLTEKLIAGFELENLQVRSNMNLIRQTGVMHTSHDNMLLDLNYINLHFLFGRKLFSIKEMPFSLSISPYYGYLIHSKAIGYSTGTAAYSYIDSLGQEQHIFGEKRYEINETNVKEISKANIGARLSLDATIHLHNKWYLGLKASYNLGIYNVMDEEKFIGIRGYALSAGLAYHFEKKYMHFNDWESK